MKTTLHPAEVAKKAFSATGGSGATPTAAQISYNNTESGLTAIEVQGAIDEVAEAISSIDNSLLAGSAHFYFDEKDGVYGYNTDEERGADTFHPFSSSNVAIGISDEQTTGVTAIDCGFRPKYLAVLIVESATGIRIYNEDYSTSKTVKSTTSGIGTEALPSTTAGQIKNITDYGFEFNNNVYNKIFRYFAIG